MGESEFFSLIDPLVPRGAGHTALSPDDRDGLLPSYIATRGELNDAEQRNIAEALLRDAPTAEALLDDAYLRGVHKAMFCDVWDWAGRYRKRETNLGVDPVRISTEVRTLVDDARAWIEHGTFDADETSVRLHHRLVFIHPFPNGNGRHGRIVADYLVRALGMTAFSWGAGRGSGAEPLRAEYIAALVRADHGEIEDLVAFARS